MITMIPMKKSLFELLTSLSLNIHQVVVCFFLFFVFFRCLLFLVLDGSYYQTMTRHIWLGWGDFLQQHLNNYCNWLRKLATVYVDRDKVVEPPPSPAPGQNPDSYIHVPLNSC